MDLEPSTIALDEDRDNIAPDKKTADESGRDEGVARLGPKAWRFAEAIVDCNNKFAEYDVVEGEERRGTQNDAQVPAVMH